MKKVDNNIGQLFNFMRKGMMIPKIIHYCWYGGKSLTRQALKCIRSWETICPDYTVMRWDEHNSDFTVNQVMNRAYKERRWALVSDIMRLLAVYQYGGIYLDLDVELLKPLDYFLRHEAYFGFENQFRINTGHGFGAEAHSAIIAKMLDIYQENVFWKPDGSFNFTACPKLNTQVLFESGFKPEDRFQIINRIAVYPSEYFCPKNYQTGKLKCTVHTYSIHHYRGTWLPLKLKIKLLILHMLGERGRKIYGRLEKALFGTRILL